MRFLANENFAGPSIDVLIEHGVEVKSIARELPGTSGQTVMELAIRVNNTILNPDVITENRFSNMAVDRLPGWCIFEFWILNLTIPVNCCLN